MSQQVCAGAALRCSQGMAPSALVVLPTNMVFATAPAANIADHLPMVNVPPFVLCRSLGNPAVALATALALGTLTPAPCLPATAAPWAPGSPKVLIRGQAALNRDSKLVCAFGGVIEIANAGQVKTQIP